MKIWFGKHSGKEVHELPDDYLNWLVGYERQYIDQSRRLLDDAEKEIVARESAALADLSVAEKIIKAGYLELAKRCHPDTGGSHEEMVELNATVEKLRRSLEPADKVRA
jgi:hypothetical protein